MTRAKIEVVLIAIGVIFAPLVAALAFASPLQAAVTALGVAIAAASATAIQLWFRVQAQAQPVSPPPDLVAAGDIRGSLFLDRLGRDRGAGADHSDRRRRHRR